MKKTIILMAVMACVAFSACTINIGDTNSGNDRRKEKKEIKAGDTVVKVYLDNIGCYYVALGKENPQSIENAELKGYLRGVKAQDSCVHVAFYVDDDASYKNVRYVMRVAQDLNMNLVFEDVTANAPREQEPNNSPLAPPSVELPTLPDTLDIVSEEEIIQHITDSIAEAKAKKLAEEKAQEQAKAIGNLFGNISFPPADNSSQSNGMGRMNCDNGQNYNLSGRHLIGQIPQPVNKFNQEGTVIVRICVNAKGDVVEALYNGGDISDKATIQLVLEAAKKTKFSEGKRDQVGTITYKLKIK